ncbi:MAG: hypothetical protein KC442_16395, partial [Thermomicrobiales bacterium]|nr:hypothetical protein [Thermomicrobiales bacterium]
MIKRESKGSGVAALSRPVLQHMLWEPFDLEGDHFDLSHLDEWQLQATDSGGSMRSIVVTCSDHCFTSRPQIDDPRLVYQQSDRRPGHFSHERHAFSLGLRGHIEALVRQHV